jgi:hypothetical protein
MGWPSRNAQIRRNGPLSIKPAVRHKNIIAFEALKTEQTRREAEL